MTCLFSKQCTVFSMRGMDTYEIIKEQIVSASGLAALVSSFGDSLYALAITLSVYEFRDRWQAWDTR